VELLAQLFDASHPDVKVVIVPGLGSGGGKKGVLTGALEVAVSSVPLTPEERDQGAVLQEYARTPLVFATALSNPVSDLTTAELVDIYSGKTQAWRDGTRLRLILRPARDSDTAVLSRASPAMEQAVKSAMARPGLKVAVTDHDAVEALETIPGALGTSTLALIRTEGRPLKTLSINGVAPTPASVASGAYPYARSFYLVTRPNPSPAVQQFVALIRSPAGRDVLARLGNWVP
jgi:phosphate transport system substrate-binding protein